MTSHATDQDPGGPELLDLSGVPCPQNTAMALLQLELMDEGEQLELLLDDGEPIENLPPSLELEHHKIVSAGRVGAQWRLLVERGED